MADSENENVFSVDIDELKSKVPAFRQFSTLMGNIDENLNRTVQAYPELSGNGKDDISNMLLNKYKPLADKCLEFVADLKLLSEGHTDKLQELGDLFDEINENTITESGGGHTGRR